MKFSKLFWFLGLHPRLHWGSLWCSQTPSREGLLAFSNRSFAPSALAICPTRMFW